jgi:GntR family transcriptional regulator
MRHHGITLHSAQQTVGARAATDEEGRLPATPPAPPPLTSRSTHPWPESGRTP